MRIGKLVIIGVGLIGGSFALALKRAGQVDHVVGVGRSVRNLERAIELGVIDACEHDAGLAVRDADLVLVATPVGQMGGVFDAIAAHLPPRAIVTDAGSTKGDVALLMQRHLPCQLGYCVPAHPIAGSDLSGAAAAQYGLFEHRTVVVAPLDTTLPDAVERVSDAWRTCGATVVAMAPADHDRVFATVSHLPHLLAFSYVNSVASRPDAQRCLDFASTGFRDFTRIAGSHPEMWRDISLVNREALLAEIDAFSNELAALRAELAAGDGDAMEARYRRARAVRLDWFARFQKR